MSWTSLTRRWSSPLRGQHDCCTSVESGSACVLAAWEPPCHVVTRLLPPAGCTRATQKEATLKPTVPLRRHGGNHLRRAASYETYVRREHGEDWLDANNR